MATTYGFFNSLNGDRTYNADQMSQYFKGLVSDGVYESIGGAMQVFATSGMNVNISSGRAIIDCKWLESDAVTTLPISAAHPTLNRWTAVVIRLDRTNRLMTLTTKDGTPASSPIQPTMTDDGVITEKCLAMVYVGAGVTVMNQANITDMRPSNLCGWVTGLIDQVSTATLFLQYKAAYTTAIQEMEAWQASMQAQFDSWFSTLSKQLNVNTYIQRFYKRVVLDGNTTEIPLDMDGYEYDSSDVLFVHVNGLLASEAVDYLIETNKNPVILHPPTSVFGSVVEITILKSKIGFPTDGGKSDDVSKISDVTVLNKVIANENDIKVTKSEEV